MLIRYEGFYGLKFCLYSTSVSIEWCMKYHIILDSIITASDCIWQWNILIPIKNSVLITNNHDYGVHLEMLFESLSIFASTGTISYVTTPAEGYSEDMFNPLYIYIHCNRNCISPMKRKKMYVHLIFQSSTLRLHMVDLLVVENNVPFYPTYSKEWLLVFGTWPSSTMVIFRQQKRNSQLDPGPCVTNTKRLLTKSFLTESMAVIGWCLASAKHSQAFC